MLHEVRPAGPKGRGLFATRPIAAGTPVLVMGGWLLPTAELTDDLAAMQVGDDLWLCSDGRNADDYSNHSCDPNLGFVTGDPTLTALRDIAADEELTWDYSTSLSEAGWTLECACGSPKCRGVVRAWPELTTAERDRLRPTALAYLRATH